MPPPSESTGVELLILGAGWTSKFLIPLLETTQVSFAATTRNGREGTILFNFDPSSENVEQYKSLPDAATILITFPVTENVRVLVNGYKKARSGIGKSDSVNWIQLGSTGSFIQTTGWVNRHTGVEPVPRSVQEEELLKQAPAAVLHLAGLWGSERSPVHWVGRIAPNKNALAAKASLHLIHGEDVARAILAAHRNFDKLVGQRWCLSDLRVYDWWELVSSWVPSARSDGERDVTNEPRLWVKQLMNERGIRALPRPMEQLGRLLDSLEFWEVIGIFPTITLHSAVASIA